ncbi:uncharacterized protein LOC119112679 [Pollicipes pollicipes]|uniref:uncharacterized protein LOC119112679 n=1 Tax=Pollicipes pollicipes TaxID=41117 RepID=UPI001884AF4E|nr:uncharacterized protein LOC119112679 [Pollicipes pollicipes]
MARGPSLKERALGLLPPEVMGQLMQRLNQMIASGLQRLPFQVQRTTRGNRTRIELTELPDYANVETVWNLSALVRARLRQPSVLSELMARPDDRRPLAALWRDGRVLALDGRSFVLPAVDGCVHLLLADVEQRGFSVLRSARHLVMTFPDCNVVVNEGGHAHVEWFNASLPKHLRTEVRLDGGRLLARSSFGLQADLEPGCGAVLLRLDPWMASRTAGLLAASDNRDGWQLSAAWRRFGLEPEESCPTPDQPAGPTLHFDSCGSIQTAECVRLTGLERAARQHRPPCVAPEPVPWRLSQSGPEADSPPVRVLLAVADPTVDADAVRRLAEVLQRQLTELGQRAVQFALVADGRADARPVWVDSPAALQLEGSKLPSADLVRSLQRAMSGHPFPPEVAYRILVVFAPSDQVRGGASLTGLRRQLWRRRVTVHLVTPLTRYPLLDAPLHGVTSHGRGLTANMSRQLSLPRHQGDLGQLVVDSAGAVWDSALLVQPAGVTSALLADAVWQQVAKAEPGPPLPDR